MKRLLILSVILTCGCGANRAARNPAVGPVGEDAEAVILERLARAEMYYEVGLTEIRNGNILDGRADIRRAFALLTSQLDEERLTEELQKDFLSMVEKMRSWQGGAGAAQRGLDVPYEKLRSVPAAKPAAAVKVHDIPINPNNRTTRKYIHIYTNSRRKSVEEALGRSGRYREMILKNLRAAGLPDELLFLVMAESEFKMKAKSRAGAGGLWQFMPYTARRYGLEVSFWVDERYNPEKATKAAIHYLSDLYQWFGDWHLAIAAYNRGEYGIGRDLKATRSLDFASLSQRGILPRETKNYVPKFMACVLIGESPRRYGLRVRYERPRPYEVVALKKPLDLKVAAKAAKTTVEALKELNPELNAWATPKNRKNYPFRVPKGIKGNFVSRLKRIKNWTPGPDFVKYKVRKGDYLGKIAKRYNTTVKSIIKLNRIKKARLIRPGMTLKVRPGRGYYKKGKKKR